MNGERTREVCAIASAKAARPFARETYAAWRMVPESPRGEAYPLDIRAETLAEAVNLAAAQCQFKDTFVILVTDTVSGKQMARFHAIKRESKPNFRRNPDTGLTERYQKQYAVELFVMAVKAFSPVEPFRWEPDCDVVGIDPKIMVHGAPIGLRTIEENNRG